MGHPMKLEVNRIVIYDALCFNVAQGCMNGAPNETRTQSYRFACLAYEPLYCPRELCKKIKFDQTAKWYMYKQESVPENETYKILWDFEMQTDLQIPTRRPDLMIMEKKKKKKR